MVTPNAAPKTPRIEVGTRLALDQARAETWAEQVAACQVDPALWTGIFATNVWAGRYEMDGVLGSGGQGTTFAGTDRKTGARVAVKVLDLKSVGDWKRVELFEREVRTLKSIEHEGMPAFIDEISDPDTGARALVMTLVPGESYKRVLERDGPLREAALWRVLVDVVDVLRVMHSQEVPIVHRDIKPLNLVRRADGRVCVVDFGGVSQRGAGGSTVVGTFGYMAPEQLYGKSSPATDMYSLGATILTLATGTEPEDLPRKGLAIDVDEAAPALSEPLRKLLKSMVAPEPHARPADAGALSKQLNTIYDRTQSGASDNDEEVDVDVESAVGSRANPDDLEEAANVLAAIVYLLIGVFGTVATVALGEVILPIFFTIATAFANGASKDRIRSARAAVDTATKVAKQGFQESAKKGAKRLEAADQRKRQFKKDAKRQRRAERKERRAHKRVRRWRT